MLSNFALLETRRPIISQVRQSLPLSFFGRKRFERERVEKIWNPFFSWMTAFQSKIASIWTLSYYQLAVSILFSFVSLLLNFTIVTFILTLSNLLLVNTCVLTMGYSLHNIIPSLCTHDNEWAKTRLTCASQARATLSIGSCTCYSYLIQSLHRLFSAVFFKNRALPTKLVH